MQEGPAQSPGTPSSPPIHLASFFLSQGDPSAMAYAYGRAGNPTWEELERELGRQEDAQATTFASGLAASFALLLVLGRTHRRLLIADDGYYGTRKQAGLLAPFGLELLPTDHADFGALERELGRGPSILWSESPTNPRLRVHDLERLSGLARRHKAPFVVDNTTATAALQRPLDLGADCVVTSLTKSASGHSDVILGSVTTRDGKLHQALREVRNLGGAIPGPLEAWLALRGVRTLALRIERQSQNASALARVLAEHPAVLAVHHPSITDPKLAGRQMPRGFGPLVSFEVQGGAAAADRVVGGARLIRPGTSFGGVESSWERRARWAGESAPEGLVRLSAGIEPLEELRADLLRALAHAAGPQLGGPGA